MTKEEQKCLAQWIAWYKIRINCAIWGTSSVHLVRGEYGGNLEENARFAGELYGELHALVDKYK